MKCCMAILFLALGSCSWLDQFRKLDVPSPRGEKYVTPGGITFYYENARAKEYGPEADSVEKATARIDELKKEWIAYWMNREPEWQREVLENRARSLPIYIYPVEHFGGNGTTGYWFENERIAVAALGRGYPDAYFNGRRFNGLEILIHEWTHVLKRYFHARLDEELREEVPGVSLTRSL